MSVQTTLNAGSLVILWLFMFVHAHACDTYTEWQVMVKYRVGGVCVWITVSLYLR